MFKHTVHHLSNMSAECRHLVSFVLSNKRANLVKHITLTKQGLWYYLPESKYPIATMVGSANYGYRSVEKDLEAQVTIGKSEF